MSIKQANSNMVRKLAVITVAMFAFGYALVPMYKAICELTGINILALGDRSISLEAGEKKQWPVAFVIDPKLSKDVSTITLSYTFFEVGGKTPPAPTAAVDKTISKVDKAGA